MSLCVFLADIRMSAAEEEKPGADYPGDSSGIVLANICTYLMIDTQNLHIFMLGVFELSEYI